MKLFEHIARIYKNKKDAGGKSKHFGLAPRFEKSELEIWKKQIKIFNEKS
jgi:hypothetical protein